jgi:hypothetical protein
MRSGQGIRPISGKKALIGFLFSVLVLSLFPLPSMSAESPPQPVGGVSQKTIARATDVVHILETFFPPGKGQISEVGPEGRVSLDRGSSQGLYPGAVVMVYRPGPPFRDFYTGLVIGRREERVGWIELRTVTPESSEGFFSGTGQVRVGDRFRMPESLVRIALVPASRYADLGVMSHLTRALQKSRRFSVVDPFRVDLAMRKMGKGALSDPAYRARLARNLKVQSLILVDTTLLGDKVLLNMEIAGGLSGEKAFALETNLTGVRPLSGGGDLLSSISPNMHAAKLPPLSVPFRTVKLPFIPFFLTEGHYIPGEGTITALSDGRRIVVGTIGNDRVRTHYRESDPRVGGNRHVFISSGPVIPPDREHPGLDQIAVTNIVGGEPDSYVLDYDGTTFRRIAKHLPWYIRIVRMSDGTTHLIGQKMGVNNAFLGHIHFLRWKLDHFEKGDKVDWPKAITLLGTLPVRTGGQNAFLKIAMDNHLEYYDARGDLRFKSPIFLGGYSNHFVFGRPHALLPVQSRSVRVKGRILVLTPPGDPGKPIAVVYKNIPMSSGFGNFQGFQYGQVYFYRWTGVNWTLLGELTRVKNFIRDIAILKDPASGAPSLVVGTEPVFNFMNIQNLIVKEGTLLYFHLPDTVSRYLRSGTTSPTLLNRPSGGGQKK